MHHKLQHKLKSYCLAVLVGLCFSIQPALAFADQQGNTVDPASWRGKWVFINYWAAWCDACLEEIPQFNAFYKQHKDQVVMLGVNDDNLPLPKLKAAIDSVHIEYPVLQTDPAKTLGLPEIEVLPTTFVIDPQGKLVKQMAGSQSAADLERVMNGR